MVLKRCRGSKSFRGGRKTDEDVLNISFILFESFFLWAVEKYLWRSATYMCSEHL